jgi:hypothetical protein
MVGEHHAASDANVGGRRRSADHRRSGKADAVHSRRCDNDAEYSLPDRRGAHPAIPVQATEQYPRGLGPTVSELATRLPERPDKVAFSSCAVPSVTESFRRGGRSKIVLAGIETHVCVLHTALDLLALDFRVYVAADAVSNRYAVDHEYALRRLEQAGAVLTTAETTVFEWVGAAGTPAFKEISRLVQERMKQL